MLPFIDLDVLMTMPNEALKKQIEIIYSTLFPEGINNGLTNELKAQKLSILKNAGIEPQTKTEEGYGFLHCIAKSYHSDLLNALIIIGFDINIKDMQGKGLLHYAVKLCQIDLIKMLIIKGLDINAKDNKGVDVFTEALYAFNDQLVKYFISEYGLKPNLVESSWSCDDPEVIFEEVRGSNNNYITFVRTNKDTTLNTIYGNYLNSFLISEIDNTKLGVPDVILGIIQSYLSSAPEEQKELEQIVQARKELLRPLDEHCTINPLNNNARAVLNSLLILIKSNVLTLEKKIDELLAQPPQDYSPSLIDCRLNTAKITGNKLRFAKSYVAIVQDILKPQLQQQANEGPQLSYMLQLKCLQTLAAVSAVALTAGLIAISLSVPIGFGIALLATGAAGGLVACGLYSQRQKVNQPIYREMETCLNLINSISMT